MSQKHECVNNELILRPSAAGVTAPEKMRFERNQRLFTLHLTVIILTIHQHPRHSRSLITDM